MKNIQKSKKDIIIISLTILNFIWLIILTGLFVWHYKASEYDYWNTLVEIRSNTYKIMQLEEKLDKISK